MRSIAMNPALCGVHKYSSPGLPSPTTRKGPGRTPESFVSSTGAYFFAPAAGALAAPSAAAASVLPFLATSGSVGVAPASPDSRQFALGRSCDYFFADRDDVSHRCVFVVQVLDLVGVRQIAYAQNAVHREFADIDVDVVRNVGRQAFDFNFAQHLVEDSTFGL